MMKPKPPARPLAVENALPNTAERRAPWPVKTGLKSGTGSSRGSYYTGYVKVSPDG